MKKKQAERLDYWKNSRENTQQGGDWEGRKEVERGISIYKNVSRKIIIKKKFKKKK